MTKRNSSRQFSVLSLAILAGPASGALLTLSDFEPLTSSAPMQCIFAYNSPIRGCQPSDFSSGSTCSEACMEGLQAIQFNVRSLCAKVDASHNNLLAQIQDANILNTLCNQKPPAPTSVPPKSSQAPNTPKTSPKAPPAAPTSKSPASSTVEPKTSTAAAPSTSSGTTTKGQSSTTSIPIETTKSSLLTSSTSFTEVLTMTSQTTDIKSPASTPNDQSPKPTKPPNSQPGSGGGSPFDFVSSSSSGAYMNPLLVALAIGIAGWSIS